tara:strand:+ start:169 stop:477 length:309 start_codon:yes stop_codon:yes gene_type:complete
VNKCSAYRLRRDVIFIFTVCIHVHARRDRLLFSDTTVSFIVIPVSPQTLSEIGGLKTALGALAGYARVLVEFAVLLCERIGSKTPTVLRGCLLRSDFWVEID